LVVAFDGERDMLEQARARLTGVVFCEAVLPRVPVRSGWADAAVANFVVNHLGDPPAGMAELVRLVGSGGKVAVTVWPSPPPPLQRLWVEAFNAAGVTGPEGLPRVPEDRDFARNSRGVTDLLCGSGLRDVDCHTITWSHRTDFENWWSGPAGGIGTLGVLMRGQPAATVAAIRREYQRLACPYIDSDGTLALPTAALLAVGTAP
ncbi:MAG TPA: methyltransferase domain-containing protein, partial [Acidimicrobiales bacterium]|nr:methyltransferase domain-containing protein [Acidimicrobiales bacterium]